MPWLTKLSVSDYSVLRRTNNEVVIQDNRNKRAFKLPEQTVRYFQITYGFQQPDNLWIHYAIKHGLIPHPYDEFV